MRPAFDSTRQASAFALLLLFVLAAPWLSAKKLLPSSGRTYSSESIRWERNPWLQRYIYEETNDIDLALVGSSHMGFGIDTPYVQQKLNERLGHPTVVRTIYWSGMGMDSLYFFTRDLLAHRRVKTLVFSDECLRAKPGEAQEFATHWFCYGEEGGDLAGLPLADQAVYYDAAMLGMPRHWFELFSPNLPNNPDVQQIGLIASWRTPDPLTRLGGFSSRLMFSWALGTPNLNFTPYAPQTRASAADLLIYSPATASHFVFTTQPLPPEVTYFGQQFGRLSKRHGCHLVALHLPGHEETTSSVMKETCNWSALMQTEVCLMGIPGRQLFAGLTEAEINKLFCDSVHLNENGQKYFTPLITPALIQFHERYSTH